MEVHLDMLAVYRHYSSSLVYDPKMHVKVTGKLLECFIKKGIIKLDILKRSKCNIGTSQESATALYEGRLPGSPPLKSIGA